MHMARLVSPLGVLNIQGFSHSLAVIPREEILDQQKAVLFKLLPSIHFSKPTSSLGIPTKIDPSWFETSSLGKAPFHRGLYVDHHRLVDGSRLHGLMSGATVLGFIDPL